jgi:phosphoglycolate phosphatase
MTVDELALVLSRTKALLLDFDGPICSVFAGSPALDLAQQLRLLLPDNGEHLADDAGPHDVLNYSTRFRLDVIHRVEAALHDGEIQAVATAAPTAGAHELFEAAAGMPIAVVSNNTGDAVRRYLTEHGYDGLVRHIEGRDPSHPRLMKPDPYLLRRAIEALHQEPSDCVLIGDTVTDVQAARAAGSRSIGYANRPGKVQRLAEAQADAVVTDVSRIARSLSEIRAQAPLR